MIEEAFVSFDNAKLLKEKGFNEICSAFYNYKGQLMNVSGFNCQPLSNSNTKADVCMAPTHQLVLRWLREIYHLHIYAFYSEIKTSSSNWCYEVERIDGNWTFSKRHGKTYEECIEEAINYTIKNLLNNSSTI